MWETIRGERINAEPVFHAIPVALDKWHAVDFERYEGISIYNRESLITRIADIIGRGYIYRLDIVDPNRLLTKSWPLDIDRAGNTWLNHKYLSPHEYLPQLIKESEETT